MKLKLSKYEKDDLLEIGHMLLSKSLQYDHDVAEALIDQNWYNVYRFVRAAQEFRDQAQTCFKAMNL